MLGTEVFQCRVEGIQLMFGYVDATQPMFGYRVARSGSGKIPMSSTA